MRDREMGRESDAKRDITREKLRRQRGLKTDILIYLLKDLRSPIVSNRLRLAIFLHISAPTKAAQTRQEGESGSASSSSAPWRDGQHSDHADGIRSVRRHTFNWALGRRGRGSDIRPIVLRVWSSWRHNTRQAPRRTGLVGSSMLWKVFLV